MKKPKTKKKNIVSFSYLMGRKKNLVFATVEGDLLKKSVREAARIELEAEFGPLEAWEMNPGSGCIFFKKIKG